MFDAVVIDAGARRVVIDNADGRTGTARSA
jgi:hypothetical protein